MATQSRLNLTRDQLASFLQDHEQIKQFERLFASVNELVPTTIADLIVNTGNADQKAVQALDALKRIADALELLAMAPTVTPQRIAQDDLTPPAERHNSIDYLDFNPLGPIPADKIGRVYWSDDDATLDVMLENGVTGQVCQQLDFHPKNTSGVQINKGQAVMATGVLGASTKITCAKAVANGSVLPQYMLGVAAQDIPANSFGYVVWFGNIRGFNTTGANKTVPETWVDGDILYFDPAYPGELTKVEPFAPNLDLPIAFVTNAANNGAIFVRMKTGEKMDELHDVHTPTPTNNDVLVYDAVDGRWENYAPTAARDAIGLGTGNPTNGQMLIGNGTDFTTAALTAGTGIAVTNGAGSATVATNLSAGTGISLSGTAPQTIATNLAAGANISITGTTPQTIAVTGLGSMAFQSTGATGSFLSANTPAKTVTVANGIITSIV